MRATNKQRLLSCTPAFLAALLCMVYLGISGCADSELRPNKYMAWMRNPKNGLRLEAEGSRFKYEVQFRPATFMALTELGPEANLTAPAVGDLQKSYEGLEYYTLKIISKANTDVTKQDARDTDEFYARLNYLTFEMQHDLALIVGADTLPCALYHCERNYGTAPYLNISLGFQQVDAPYRHDRQLQVLSRIESEPALFTFDLPKDRLTKIPKLKVAG